MNHPAIGLIAAMPEEIKPLLSLVGPYRKDMVDSFSLYRFKIDNAEACLIASGMGPLKGAAAAQVLIDTFSPSVLINFGFAGGATMGPVVGDLVMADRLLFYHDGNFFAQEGLSTQFAGLVEAALDNAGDRGGFKVFHQGTFITAAQITEKQSLVRLLPEVTRYPMLEMETSAVARVAVKERIPLIAVRAVSDAADEELGFSIDEFTDGEMNIRIARVLATMARKPRIIPQLIRLAGNAKKAGSNLAHGIRAILDHLSAL